MKNAITDMKIKALLHTQRNARAKTTNMYMTGEKVSV